MRLHRGLPGLHAGLPAGAKLPLPARGAAQLCALFPAPNDHLPGGGGAALHPRRLGAHVERVRGQGPAGIYPPHQPDDSKVQGGWSLNQVVPNACHLTSDLCLCPAAAGVPLPATGVHAVSAGHL